MSEDLKRENTDLQAEASALRQLATELVVELRIARIDAYGTDHAETADILDLAASILDNRRAGQPLLEEVARLEAQARMAALVEACTAVADFIETYTPDSAVAHVLPTFYSVFRVYGKNARAAVAAVRPQADALLAERAALIALNMRYVTALQTAYTALLRDPGSARSVALDILHAVEEASEDR